MRRAAASGGLFSLASSLLLLAQPESYAIEGNEPEQYEERLINRWVEKGFRIAKSDRTLWVKELEAAFPDQVVNAFKEEEYASWFVLLAGKGMEWKRDDSPNTQIAELFDRVAKVLELGPVPSIRREEFMKYSRHVLMPANPNPPMPGADPIEDADKAFRVLDRNGDGVLQQSEMTPRLREEASGALGGKKEGITKEQYREYFQRQVSAGVDAAITKRLADKAAEKAAIEKAMSVEKARNQDVKSASKPGKPAAPLLPSWFAELDTNMDGQISLPAWRKSGRSISLFMEMDLNGDGLLTKEEYLQYVRLKEEKEKEENPPPPVKPIKK